MNFIVHIGEDLLTMLVLIDSLYEPERQMVDESWLSQYRVGKRDSEWADSIFRVGLLNCLENVASMRCEGVYLSAL